MATKTAKKKKSRKRRGPSKSQAIRNYLESSPDAPAKEVKEALRAKNMVVSDALVNNVKHMMRKGKSPAKSTTTTAGRGGRAGRAANGAGSFDGMFEAKRLADQLGGIEEAKAALDNLKKLQ